MEVEAGEPSRQGRRSTSGASREVRAVEGVEPVAPRRSAPAPDRHNAEPAFRPGEAVVHPLFGTGTVIESRVTGDDEEVTVAFEGRGIKRLMASYAKLAKP